MAALGRAPLRFATLRRAKLGPKITSGHIEIGALQKPSVILKKARTLLVNLEYLSLQAFRFDQKFDEQTIRELAMWKSLRDLELFVDNDNRHYVEILRNLQRVFQVKSLHLTTKISGSLDNAIPTIEEVVHVIPNHITCLHLDVDVKDSLSKTTNRDFVPELREAVLELLRKRFEGTRMEFVSVYKDGFIFYDSRA